LGSASFTGRGVTSPESGGVTTRKRIIVGGLRKQKCCGQTLLFLEIFDPPRLKRKDSFIYCTAAPPVTKPSRKNWRPTTQEMLLPLPATVSRPKCIALREALSLLASSQGTMSTVAQLLNAVYCAYFVHETVVRQPDLNLFSAAEAALHQCAVRGEITGKFDVSADGQIAIQRVLGMHDQQLVTVPAYIVVDAEVRLTELLSTEFSSPIASRPDARPLH